VAKPPDAVAVVVPCKEAVPALRAAVTTVLLSEVIKFPNESSIRTTVALEKTVPAVAVLGGWVWTVSLLAAAGLTVNVLLIALFSPVAVAVICFVPAVSISRLLNDTTPFAAAVPISRLAVPCNGPVPLVSVKATVRLEGKPLVESLPKASWLLMTGWVAKIDPAVAPAGWVANTSVLAAAGLIAIWLEVALVKAPLLNRMVMLVATLW